MRNYYQWFYKLLNGLVPHDYIYPNNLSREEFISIQAQIRADLMGDKNICDLKRMIKM